MIEHLQQIKNNYFNDTKKIKYKEFILDFNLLADMKYFTRTNYFYHFCVILMHLELSLDGSFLYNY